MRMLNRQWRETLSNMPESGMGYQKVDIFTIDGKVFSNIIILNCEVLDRDLPIRNREILTIKLS
jgi:hypothetical protein